MPESFSVSIDTLDSTFLASVDSYWAQFLGCPQAMLRKEKTQLLPHAELRDYAGCYTIEFGAAPIVSLPANEVESYRDLIARWQPGVVRTPAVAQAAFHERIASIIGPAFIGYTDTMLFKQPACGDARLLTNADGKAAKKLRSCCPAEEWDHGGSTFRPSEMVGVMRGQQLVAVASYKVWGERIAHISIIGHPAFRGRGYATNAVGKLTRIVLERKLVPQYRTLEANQPSMAIARRLGFVQYATSMAIRFRPSSAKTSRSRTA
jgi:ribosomal protein S18 acetylase RimI-like enzyme